MSYATIHAGLVLEKATKLSVIKVILTLFPYIPFHFMAQTKHMEFGVIWFSSIIFILLQDTKRKNVEFAYFSAAFVCNQVLI